MSETGGRSRHPRWAPSRKRPPTESPQRAEVEVAQHAVVRDKEAREPERHVPPEAGRRFRACRQLRNHFDRAKSHQTLFRASTVALSARCSLSLTLTQARSRPDSPHRS